MTTDASSQATWNGSSQFARGACTVKGTLIEALAGIVTSFMEDSSDATLRATFTLASDDGASSTVIVDAVQEKRRTAGKMARRIRMESPVQSSVFGLTPQPKTRYNGNEPSPHRT